MISLFVVFVSLQIGDAWTTYTIVKKQGGREINPIAKSVLDVFGVFVGLLVLKTLAVVLGLYLMLSGEAVFLASLDAMYAVVVWNNARQIK